MQHIILLIAPAAAILLSYIFFKRIRIMPVALAVILGAGFNFGISEWMKSRNATDVEYLGYYAKDVEYYEAWDEWVEKTCTRNGEEYDCSYRQRHAPYWLINDSGGESERITQSEYNEIVDFLNTAPVFVDLSRRYYEQDGDMYFAIIPPGKLMIPVTRQQRYRNKIITNQSLYHFETISAGEKDSLGLYDYPEITHTPPKLFFPAPVPASIRTYQSSTLGCDDDEFTRRMDSLNARSGTSSHLRTFVFFFPGRGREIARKQIDYLPLGNFNELLILLGTQGSEITWCETHSWEDSPQLRTAVQQWFVVNNHTDSLQNFPGWYANQIAAGLWTLKDYHDFDYIRTSITLAQVAWLAILQLAFQALAMWGISVYLRKLASAKKKRLPI
ncbi:MAG: hypothetical protein LBI89_01130 [Prevotellaceae bacterium]|jgi:hypothetical protein|nr:hypothetical protein [Prevotellaceae bacterium]